MRITSGILCGQVLQRDGSNTASVTIGGTSAREGDVQVRLCGLKRKGALSSWVTVGACDGKRFGATVSGIPAGGPYGLELRVCRKRNRVDRLTVDPIFVGDVWILGGQSNMQGCGHLRGAPKPHPMVRGFRMCDEWSIACEPLHFLSESVDGVHHALAGRTRRPTLAAVRKEKAAAVIGVGVGVSFGKEMFMRTRVPQGLIACAHGGTSMAQWSPLLANEGGNSLYGAMLRRHRKLGQHVAGVLWYQGESDAAAPQGYREAMEELVAASRRDLNLPELPWCVVQLGRVVGNEWDGVNWNLLQEQQRKLPETIPFLDVVPAVDLELEDTIHISARDAVTLARRLARSAARLAHRDRKAKGGIRLQKVECNCYTRAGERGHTEVKISFDHVVGGLTSPGRPVGFSVTDAEGRGSDIFYKTCPRGRTVVLETLCDRVLLEDCMLHYGRGCNPVVNIHDRENMGLPVFGPVRIMARKGTPFVRHWRVLRIARGGLGPARTCVKTGRLPERGWHASFAGPDAVRFMGLPVDPAKALAGTFLMRGFVTAREDCRVAIALGSDSPFEVWVNRARALVDPDGINPCLPDQYEAPVDLRKGKNEILVAFDTRGGQGWGICARFKPVENDGSLPEGLLAV